MNVVQHGLALVKRYHDSRYAVLIIVCPVLDPFVLSVLTELAVLT